MTHKTIRLIANGKCEDFGTYTRAAMELGFLLLAQLKVMSDERTRRPIKFRADIVGVEGEGAAISARRHIEIDLNSYCYGV